MKFKYLETGAHQIKQYMFRINVSEIEALITALEFAHANLPKSPTSKPLMDVRNHINIARKELKRALRQLETTTVESNSETK